MTNYPKSMDPDRYQMKDIKNRLRKVEILATSTASSWARWKQRIRDLEGSVADIAEALEYLQTHTFVRTVGLPDPSEKEVSKDIYSGDAGEGNS